MSVEEPLKDDQIDVPRECWVSGEALPAFMEIDGQSLALITLEEYRELVRARSAVVRGLVQLQGREAAKRPPRLGLSTVERDTEVADFLRERFRGGITVAQIRQACRERFGEERTPSIQRISRFRLATRRLG